MGAFSLYVRPRNTVNVLNTLSVFLFKLLLKFLTIMIVKVLYVRWVLFLFCFFDQIVFLF